MLKFVFVVFLAAVPALAASKDVNFESCHLMSTNYIRLMCYDKETGYIKEDSDETTSNKLPISEKDKTEETSGQHWRYSDDTSALDNRKDVWLSVLSQNTEANSIGSPIRATFWVRCMENKTNVLVGFERYTTDNQNVKYKLDNDLIQKQWMVAMRGGDGIGIWSGSKAIPFIKKLFGKEKLVVAYDTYTGPVEFTFNVSGLRKRIEPLAKECEWVP